MDWAPVLLSLRIATTATIVAVILGVALAALLAWEKTPARELLDALITAPMVLPPTVLGYYLLVAVGKESTIGRAFHAVFGFDIVFTFTGAVVAAVVGSLPFVVKASRAAIEEVDPKLQQAARTLGAGPVRIFFTVTLPLARRGVIAGTMLGWAKALGDFGITLMVVGMRVGDTSPASIQIYGDLNAGNEAAARKLAIVMTVIAVSIMFTVNRLLRRPRGH